MPRRIDVELTSAKEDGSFTWRAAGAKKPKGVVPGSLLYGGAKVGDVVRAEADFDVEGITIVSVVPPPHAAAKPQPARIEIVGTGREEPGVTSSAVSRGGERRGPRDGERRGTGGPSERSSRGPGGGSDRGARPSGPPDRAGRGPRPDGGGGRPERGERPGDNDRRGPRPERSARPERAPRPERAQGDRPGRPPRDHGGERSRPKRLSPASTHRDAYLASLVPEQQVVAELLLRGGIPAVRAAVAQQNQNRAEGTPVIDAEPLVGLAETMLPSVREAEWRDRAEAAKGIIEEVGLRDLRAIVTASDASARGAEAKELAGNLRDALERRTTAQREEWLAEMATCLADGKVIRAVRLSSRPPDPTTKVPPELLEQLRAAAGEALGPDTPQDQWAALLEAVVASPVRRTVKPRGLPTDARPALQLAAKQASGRIPALAAMLGVDLPPPPGPRPGRAPRPGPPPPPRPAAAPTAPAPTAPVDQAPAPEPAPAAPDPEPAPAAPVDQAPVPEAAPAAAEPDPAPEAPAADVAAGGDGAEVAGDGLPERIDEPDGAPAGA